MIKTAMLFCAGLGTRLRPITNDIPKALVPVNGKTLLERNVEYLKSFGFEKIVINVHHFADKIEELLKEKNNFNIEILVSDEREEVLETGGGLLYAAPLLRAEEHILLMNVDILTDMNLDLFKQYHLSSKNLVTLAVTNRDSSRKLLWGQDKQLVGWKNLAENKYRWVWDEVEAYDAFAFSGIHLMDTKLLDKIVFSGKFSILDIYFDLAKHHSIKYFDHSQDVLIDVGKHDSLAEANRIFH